MVTKKNHYFKSIKNNPSLLGFGCMRLPLIEDTTTIDKKAAFEMFDLAYQNGVNYFDTAYPYHEGKSELIVGEALKRYPRESFNLATKMPTWLIKNVDDAIRIFNEQLTKLQVNYFDYYLCHALNKNNFEIYKDHKVWNFLLDMKKQGKIKHLGFSFHDTPEVLSEIISYYKWDFVQLQINYLDWDYINAKKMYEIACNHNLPIIVMEPVRGGTLASLSNEAVEILKNENAHNSIASWAIRYVGSLDNVLVILSGMSNLEQTLDNIKTTTDFQKLTKQENIILQKALHAFFKETHIPCTGCNYCDICPQKITIPTIFKMYNDYLLNNSLSSLKQKYQKLEDYQKADNCIECKKCINYCPQNIAIPSKLSDITKILT